MRYTGPKNRLARREGEDLGLKTPGSKSQTNLLRRINIVPGQHAGGRMRKRTDYGNQLREKQKVKRIYGLSEKQMALYFDKANRSLGNTAEILIQNLERRVDNVLYRLRLAPTRAAARQLVNHGHIMINKTKVTIPSYLVRVGDVISFRKEQTTKIPYIGELLQQKEALMPEWVEKKGTVGKIVNLPNKDNYTENVNLQSVIEFYSR